MRQSLCMPFYLRFLLLNLQAWTKKRRLRGLLQAMLPLLSLLLRDIEFRPVRMPFTTITRVSYSRRWYIERISEEELPTW